MKNINKLLISMAVTASLASAVTPARAATTTDDFTVSVTLTSVCEVSSAVTDVTFSYTAFQPGISNSAGGAFGVTCTTGETYNMSLDTPGAESVGGLTYALSVDTGNKVGTGAAQNYTLTGTMAGGQAGDTGAATTQNRTLTITY